MAFGNHPDPAAHTAAGIAHRTQGLVPGRPAATEYQVPGAGNDPSQHIAPVVSPVALGPGPSAPAANRNVVAGEFDPDAAVPGGPRIAAS